MTRDAKPSTSDAIAAPPGFPMLPVSCLRPVVEALERLGIDVASLLTAVGIPPALLADPDGKVSCVAYGELIERARQGARNLGLRAAQATPIGAYPLIDYLVLSSATVGEGLRRLSRYYRLIGAPTGLELHEDEDPIRVVVDAPAGFVAEYAVALPLLHLRRESQGGARAEWVSLLHHPDDPAALEAALGCPVRGGAGANAFGLSRATWALPMARRDPVLLGVLERHAEAEVAGLAESNCLAPAVRRAQALGLARGDAGIETIARALATTPRTLQRRLASEGTSFQQELDRVRRDIAERHLREATLSIGEISFALGYSEPAAFHRAFKRWHRTTPQAFRAGPRDGAPAGGRA